MVILLIAIINYNYKNKQDLEFAYDKFNDTDKQFEALIIDNLNITSLNAILNHNSFELLVFNGKARVEERVPNTNWRFAE